MKFGVMRPYQIRLSKNTLFQSIQNSLNTMNEESIQKQIQQ